MNGAILNQSRKPQRDWKKLVIHLLLILSVCLIGFPLYYGFVISTQSMEESIQKPQKLLPSGYLLENYMKVWNRIHMGRLLLNSSIVALVVSLGKIAISILSAFAIVYFNFRGKQIAFWMIFITLMLPVPVRIISTYQVVSDLGWVDTYAGLTIPLIASATATFLFRQFYLTIPDELVDAAKIDGAGPLRFLWSILLPNSRANMAALFVVMFIYGWNQYLWPHMITNSDKMKVVVVGIASTVPVGTQLPEWNLVMAAAMMALLPPVLVIILMQRWFVHGLIESEK
ncbi:MAG: sn-glycerol-3-phosphate ABC transporter permease UgpE [Desulfobacterales bacterium]|nr:sn-glycerol-3-phosphate ABC transporter permease UgpE [Desulfobacterales bacterium]